jgi:hypothetical protein
MVKLIMHVLYIDNNIKHKLFDTKFISDMFNLHNIVIDNWILLHKRQYKKLLRI